MEKDNSTTHPAREYDAGVKKTIPFYDIFPEISLELINVLMPNPLFWLDTGCGTGSMALKASKILNSAKFICADPSEAMLAVVKDKIAVDSNEHIEILPPASTKDIKLDQGSLDVVTAILCHHYLMPEERMEATKNCHKLLRQGGVYITFEAISPSSTIGIGTGLKMWGNYQLSQGKTTDEVSKHLSRYGNELRAIKVEDHIALLKKCGFKTVELFWYSYMHAGFYAIK
jgi:tRNA (cmo5U34)-methyltransferase